MRMKQSSEYTKWYGNLKDRRVKARIDLRIRRLQLGNAGDVKAIGEGISELRIKYGPGYRVYYKQTGNQIILLLVGGDKSTQNKDIKLAKKLIKILEV